MIVAVKSGQVYGVFFTYHGGDDVYPDAPPVPTYATAEGLPYSNVVAWAPMSEFPNDLL